MKNILITGGTGFIGLNLIKKLLLNDKKSNIRIYVLTRKKEIFINISDNDLFSKIIFIKGDIRNFSTNIKFNEIYHLAYDTHTNNDFLKYTSNTIIDGIVNISKICRDSNTKKLVFISSGAIYENVKRKGFKTNDTLSFNLFNKNEHYGILKAASEHYLWSIFSNTNTQILIYRVFAVIGPYMRLTGNFIIGNLINNLLKNKSNTFNTDCNVFRNIIFVDDLIEQITNNKNKNFIVENIIGKNVNLRDFLLKLSKKEKFKIKFGRKKNYLRVYYTPFIKKDNYNTNYLYQSFNKTYNWYKEVEYRKIII